MIIIFLLIGAILIVAAVRNSQDALFSALGEDVPGFFIWAAALIALGAIGWIPGLKPISRGLLALVIVVLILHNYQNIIKGFQNAGKFDQPKNKSTGGQSATSLVPQSFFDKLINGPSILKSVAQ